MSSKKAHITDDPTFVVVSLKKKMCKFEKEWSIPIKNLKAGLTLVISGPLRYKKTKQNPDTNTFFF